MNKIAENELTKLYYSIGEVAEMFDVNHSLIRFWEKEFDLKLAKKNKKGNRLFTKDDILKFNKIYQLVKLEGFTLEGAKKQLLTKKVKLDVETDLNDPNQFIIQKLEKIKLRLMLLK